MFRKQKDINAEGYLFVLAEAALAHFIGQAGGKEKSPCGDPLLCWGSGIRTPISTSRAWRAAVAPIPKATGILPLNLKIIGKKPLF
jgi:hypothetical protein